MLDILKDIFDNVNNWLKFAEAKNGAIIALNATFIFGVLKLGLISDSTNILLQCYLCIAIFMLLSSIIIALLSFIPQLNYLFFTIKEPSEKDNLLYFGDIAKYTPSKYQEKLALLVEIKDTNNVKLNDNYIGQIIVNSKITYIKFKQFEIAIWLTISAILTPIGGILLYYSKTRH